MNLKNILLLSLLLFTFCLFSQVDYNDDGQPWKRTVSHGPDADVPGWYYNLGITGIRAQLITAQPKTLEVKYIIRRSPAYRKIKIGDLITGVNGVEFQEAHQDGYGMGKFGAQGPISELASHIESAQSLSKGGKITLHIKRNDKEIKVPLKLSTKYGVYATSYPNECKKSSLITSTLIKYIAENQQANGSFGSPVENLWCPLALMASGNSRYMRIVKKNIKYQAELTKSEDRQEGLINWSYLSAGIVLSEYYLKTKDKKILPELKEILSFLNKSQYLSMKQINFSSNHKKPKDEKKAHGGWGHNPGYEGYGPIGMTTGMGALAYTLMKRCDLEVNSERHKKAYDFLKRGTGDNGYTWYEDEVSNHNNYADMGRTGVSSISHWLNQNDTDVDFALHQSKLIGDFPLSFPDTHGSPILGMGFTALGASINNSDFHKLMQANKYWFTMAQCPDGTFYYQPNRDNAGYGKLSRLSASAVTAFIFLIPEKSLILTGK
jgi:hypothetical protein